MKTFRLFVLLTFLSSGILYAATAEEEYQAGVQHLQKDEYNEAIEAFKRILEMKPDFAPAYNLLGLTYMKQNKSIKSAIGSFEEAIRLDPKYADAYFNLATAYANTDQNDLAGKYFQKTIEVDPQFSKAYFGMGWFTLMSQGDGETALKYFEKTIEVHPDFPEAYYGMGLAYFRLGKGHMALEPISHLRELHRNDLAGLLEATLAGESPSEPAGDGQTQAAPAEQKAG